MYVDKYVLIAILIFDFIVLVNNIYLTKQNRELKRKSIQHQLKKAAESLAKLKQKVIEANEEAEEKRANEAIKNINKFLNED